MHASRLRLHLHLALGLAPVALIGCTPTDDVDCEKTANCEPETGDTADTDVVTDTDVADTDVADTDVADTDVAHTDVTDTDVTDTDVADTDVTDTDVTDTDTVLVTCDEAPDGNAYVVGGGVPDGSTEYRVCLDLLSSDGTCLPAWSSGGPEANDLLAALCLKASANCTNDYMIYSVTCGPYDYMGSCCYTVTAGYGVVIGRPFATEQGFRTACAVRAGGWSSPATVDVPRDDDAAAAWTTMALGEHASIASFGSFVMDLMALGAPAELVRDAVAAMADEVRHAELAFGLASALGGARVAPGALPTSDARRRVSAEAVLMAVIDEGCVGETVAAHDASVRRDLGCGPAVRDALATIAEDEARHAALAWRTAQWILTQHPELLPVAERTFAASLAARRTMTTTDEPNRPALGLHDAAQQQRATERALDSVVAPTWSALRGAVALS